MYSAGRSAQGGQEGWAQHHDGDGVRDRAAGVETAGRGEHGDGLGIHAELQGGRLAGVGLYFLFDWWWADAVGALAMLPVILWQGWETLGEAREREHDHDDTGHRRGK